jgi:hypothetical protein
MTSGKSEVSEITSFMHVALGYIATLKYTKILFSLENTKENNALIIIFVTD